MAHHDCAARPLRLAHISDLHFSADNLEESDRCVGFAVQAAIEENVDALIVSGDATDHALETHAPAFHALVRHMRRCSEHFPVLMLQGTYSHEPPGSLNVFRLLGGRFPIYVADRLQQVALMADGSWQASPAWRFDALPADEMRALFSCIPTLNKAQVAAVVGGEAAGQAVGDRIGQVLAGLAPVNGQARARGVAAIGVGHGTVNGCESEHGVAMSGLDHEFSAAGLFAAGTDAFLLGHIHKHQRWEHDGRLVAYAGSIGRFHYGEPGDKGFLIWELDRDRVRAELVPTPARRTVELAFAGTPDVAQLAAAMQDRSLAGAFVRVRWNVAEEDRDQVDRDAILRALEGAAGVKLEGRIIPLQRARAPGIAQQASIAGKAEAWAIATGVDPAPLRYCLEALLHSAAADIAQTMLAAPPAVSFAEARPVTQDAGAAVVDADASQLWAEACS